MKDIKRLGITTQEGFEVQNLQRFPSMEWGPEGGMQADVYYKGNKVLQVFQEGNGGPAITYAEDYYREHEVEINLQLLRFLRRVDKNYGPDSPYDWLKNKKVSLIKGKQHANGLDDDDWEALVNNIEDYYVDVKTAGNSFRVGFKAVACLKNDYETKYLQYRVSDITLEEVQQHMKKLKLDTKYPEVKILLPVPELSIL